MEGITQFFAGDYARAVEILNPVMPDVQKMIQGPSRRHKTMLFDPIIHLLFDFQKLGAPLFLSLASEASFSGLYR